MKDVRDNVGEQHARDCIGERIVDVSESVSQIKTDEGKDKLVEWTQATEKGGRMLSEDEKDACVEHDQREEARCV